MPKPKLAVALAAVSLLAGPAWAAGDCTVAVDDVNFDGVPELLIRGGPGPKNLVLDLTQTQTVVSLDCDGNNNFTGPNDVNQQDFGAAVQTLDTRLLGASKISLNINGAITGRVIGFPLRCGASGTTVTVGGPGSLTDSTLVVEIQGGAGIDRFTFNLPTGGVDHSTVLMRAEAGDGNDWLTATTPGPVTGGSVVEFRLDGSGHANRFFYTHSGSIVGSSVAVDVQGGAGLLDLVANELKGPVGPGGSLRYRAKLARGSDSIVTNVDLGLFSVAANAAASFKVDGQDGGETISFTRNGTTGGTQAIDGLLELAFNGGLGPDKISVDLGGGGFVVNGTLKLRLDGFSGGDTIDVTADVAAGSNPTIDAAIYAGNSVDKINFALNNSGANAPANYGPAQGVILDGGFTQLDVCAATGNAIVLKRNCEK
jgi:hypothetical protein